MTDKILVPVDGSENSLKGLRYACWLAGKLSAAVTVMHVVNIPYTGQSAVLNVESLIAVGQGILDDAKKVVEEENLKGADYELRQGSGNPGHEVIKLSKEGNFSLIVMSAKGHTIFTHLMGSVSDMVVHHAPCPVLIIR